ncbi:caspase family protein [Massilia sp. DWR3-1-1]|uniref:caspase family protein n=1 Tax=Massilia sp. DWR3-1-1 TaxID=2804559 RepID=UPI003CE930E5
MKPASIQDGRRLLLALLVACIAGAAPAVHGAAAPATLATLDYRQAPKFALVVGNQRYGGAFALKNAERDAQLIASRLREAGYSTTLRLNADRATLYADIGKLAAQLRDGGVGAFYYAGHGVQQNGRNYLVPVDASMQHAAALAPSALPVDYLIERLKDSGAHLSLILLDACRNDPGGADGRLYRGGGDSGFVAALPANGMLVAYATQPGERAQDGSGEHGPFALALANWLTRPGVAVEQAMKHVMTQVRASTRDEQRPWMATSMVGSFALVPAAGQPALLFRPRAGAPEAAGARALPAAGAPPGIVQWFQSPDLAQQMLLTTQIAREARALNADDLPRLTRQARGGSVVAQAVLGSAYRDGFGVGTSRLRSNVEALKWLRMAAQQAMPYALNELGEMHYLGHGVPRDSARARSYFQAAADQGYAPARLNLFQLSAETGTPDLQLLLR